MTGRAPAIELADELLVLRRAVEGVRRLTEFSLPEFAESERTAREATRAAVAVASLIAERLLAVERAVRGTRDPVELVAEHNEVIEGVEGGTQLHPWSQERRREEAQRELRRAMAERQTVRSRRRR